MKNLGKKINNIYKKIEKLDANIQEKLDDINYELADTNNLSVINLKNIKILAEELGIIKSWINYKLNNNTHNSNYETETEQWAKHLNSMRNTLGQHSRRDGDALADASIYLEPEQRIRGGNKKQKSRRKRTRRKPKRTNYLRANATTDYKKHCITTSTLKTSPSRAFELKQ